MTRSEGSRYLGETECLAEAAARRDFRILHELQACYCMYLFAEQLLSLSQ